MAESGDPSQHSRTSHSDSVAGGPSRVSPKPTDGSQAGVDSTSGPVSSLPVKTTTTEGQTASSDQLPPVPIQPRIGTPGEVGTGQSLPPKPPMRSRTTGSAPPAAAELLGPRSAIWAGASPLIPRPRQQHFRDLSDMTMDTMMNATEYFQQFPQALTTSEEEVEDEENGDPDVDEQHHDALTQLSNSHSLRLSFCIMLSEKSLTCLKPPARTQVSLLRPIADLYGLSSYDMVTIHKVKDEGIIQDLSADFVLVTIKDQFISRGDMHYFVSNLLGTWVYEGQRLLDDSKGIQAHAKEIRHKDKHAYSGIITDQTKITFRSRSSRLIWLVQLSAEMWDFVNPFDASSGDEGRCETYFDKWIAFVKRLFAKWKEQETSHSLTVVFFSRTFIGSGPNFSSPSASKTKDNSAVQRDMYGRRYEDHFRLVIENATSSDLDSLIVKMKKAFVHYPAEVGWNSLTGEASRRPSLASQGNVLEATNVTLNLLQFHFFDRDLNRTGNSLVIISAGNGVFEVDKELAGITYQRMMDNGIGSDMLSLSLPPMHIAPFFLYTDLTPSADLDNPELAAWEIPHWLHLSFISYDSDGAIGSMIHVQNKYESYRLPLMNIAGHTVAANGFILPASYDTSKALKPAADSLLGQPTGSGVQGRQLIAGRDFRDILDACRPRNIGELPSALKSLLIMYNNHETHQPIMTSRLETITDEVDGTTMPEWAALQPTSDVLDNSDLYRRRAISVGQESSSFQESPLLGSVTGSLRAHDENRRDTSGQASSLESREGGSLLGFSYDDPFSISSPKTGFQLQRSPSFHIPAQYEIGEFKDEDTESEMKEAISDSSSASAGMLLDDTNDSDHGVRKQGHMYSAETKLRQLMNMCDLKLIMNPLPEMSALALPSEEDVQSRNTNMPGMFLSQPIEPRSSYRSAHSVGGLGLAMSRYQSSPKDAKTDEKNEQPDPPAVARVSSSTRLHGSSYARRQFEMSARGMSPLLLPSVLSVPDNSDVFSQAHLHIFEKTLPISTEGKYSNRKPSRSLGLASMSKSPPTSNSPTLTAIEHHGQRQLYSESGDTTSPSRRLRSTNRGSRRRKAFNPFRQQDEDEVLAKKTHNRLRWTHVFPLGEIEFKRHAGPSWKSLSIPAILPLSVDYFPSQQEVDHNYTFSIYNITRAEFENTPYSNNLELMREMVRQRLTQDYQLVPNDHPNVKNFRRETLRRADVDKLSSEKESPETIRVFLSMGYSLQVLTYDPAVDVIEVTRYDAKDARTQKNENSSFKYCYLSFCENTSTFVPVIQTFTKYSALYNWNKVDRIICGDEDREMREGMRFKRIMFAVLPERCESFADQEVYISKFQKLIDYFEKLREKDGSSESFEIEMVRFNDKEKSSESRKTHMESTPGISWNAMKRFYVRLKKGKSDTLEWLEIVVDSTFKTCWSYRIMFQWLVASSGKVEAQVQMLYRRCTQFGLKLVPFPQLSVSKDVFLNPFKTVVFISFERHDSVDNLDDLLQQLDYLHDGVFFTDVQAIKDCMQIDFDFGRRWTRTLAGRQFVHRSGTLFVRILTDAQGRAIVAIFINYIYVNKDGTVKALCQHVFELLLAQLGTLNEGAWENTGTDCDYTDKLTGEETASQESTTTNQKEPMTELSVDQASAMEETKRDHS